MKFWAFWSSETCPCYGKAVELDDLLKFFQSRILWFYTAISWQEKDEDFSSLLVSNTSEQSLNLVITVKAFLLSLLLM